MKTTWIATVAGVLALTGGTTMAHSETVWKQMTVKEQGQLGKTTVIDLGKKGTSAGDLTVWNEPVVDEAEKPIGTSNGFCIVTLPGKLSECRWTLSLHDGTISLAGTEMQKGTSPVAVVGGTGTYAGITGEAAVTPQTDGTWIIQMRFKK